MLQKKPLFLKTLSKFLFFFFSVMSMPIGHFEPESAAIQESNEAIEPLVDIILGNLFVF